MIKIAPYDPRWPVMFEAEAARIRASLGSLALRIDHHGSTSVPGLAAKPVIDIQVSVAQLHPLSPYCEALAPIGYTHVQHPDDSFCPFFHRPASRPHSYHLHLVEHGGLEERRTLAFRDYLRDHRETAAEYEALKRQLALRFSAEREQDYADAKGELIERMTSRALAAGLPRTR